MEILEFDKIALIDGLSKQLADTCILRLKTEGYYWNVAETALGKVRPMLLLQCAALDAAAGEISACVRDLGVRVPGSYKQFSDLARIDEELGEPNTEQMISQLKIDYETMAQNAITLFLVAKAANYS